jgi:N-acetylglucosamine-6-phosphate deacetylase
METIRMRRFLKGCRVFTGERILSGYGVLLDGDSVAAVLPVAEVPDGAEIVELAADAILAPGFIDVQVNGAGGVLFNETPDTASVLRMTKALRPFGVTGTLPTFITDSREAMTAACAAVESAVTDPQGGVMGIHLEGPFLSPERAGIHNPAFLRHPDDTDHALIGGLARRLTAGGARVLLTLAPERVADTAIQRFIGDGVIVAAGHTAASYERVEEAFALGVHGVTHIANTMPPIGNRAPGPVIAALAARDAWCGLIADGHHVHPGLMRVMLAAKTPGKVFFVTDAMPPVGTAMTEFTLYGQTILRRGGKLTSLDGVLAGADIDMAATVRNGMTLLGLPLTESLRMASLYPAAYLGLDRRFGRIAAGYRADFALIDDTVNVRQTWIGGALAWNGALPG